MGIGAYLYVYVLSAVLVVGPLAAGVALARRGRQRKNALTMAYGMAIAASSSLVGAALAIVASSPQDGPYAKLFMLLIPPLTLAAVLGLTILCVSLAVIGLWIKRQALQSEGYTRLPSLLGVAVALCIVVVTSVFVYERYLGPRWQMRPYSTLSSSGSVDSVSLSGWLAHSGRHDTIISIDKSMAPKALVSFDLFSLNSAGNITLRVDPDPHIAGDELSHSIRLEPSVYALTPGGTLSRVNEEDTTW